MTPNVILRRADMTDADQLLAWRNDALTVQNSIKQKGKITKDEHMAWLEKTLADPNVELFIGVHDLVPVGSVRFDFISEPPEEYIISLVVAPVARQKGMGAKMLSTACLLKEQDNLVAFIKRTNLASIKLFEGRGFSETGGDEILCFRRPPLLI